MPHRTELYPSLVYSKPESTAIPSYLFSGAYLVLIPSRDEPFGLVAVNSVAMVLFVANQCI